jgi:hypothetical protein
MGKGKMMRCLRRSNGRSNANHDSPSNVLRSAITESSTTEYSPHHCVGTRTMLDKIHCIHQSYLPYIQHSNTTSLGIHARFKTALASFPLSIHKQSPSLIQTPKRPLSSPIPLPIPLPIPPLPLPLSSPFSTSPPPTLSITHTPSPSSSP